MTDGLTFESEGHVYRIGNRVMPSITQVLHACNIRHFDPRIPPLVLEKNRVGMRSA